MYFKKIPTTLTSKNLFETFQIFFNDKDRKEEHINKIKHNKFVKALWV